MENNIKKIVAAVLLLATSGVYASTLHAAEVEHVVTPSSHSMSMSRAREHEQQLHTQMSTDSHGSEVSAVSMGHASFTDEVCADGHCVAHATEYELKPRKLSFTISDPKSKELQLRRGTANDIFGAAKKPSKAARVLGINPDTKTEAPVNKENLFRRLRNTIAQGAQAVKDAIKEHSDDEEDQLEVVQKRIFEGGMSPGDLVRLKSRRDNLKLRVTARNNLQKYYNSHPGLKDFYDKAVLGLSFEGSMIDAENPLYEQNIQDMQGWPEFYDQLRDEALRSGRTLSEEEAVKQTKVFLQNVEQYIQAYEKAKEE